MTNVRYLVGAMRLQEEISIGDCRSHNQEEDMPSDWTCTNQKLHQGGSAMKTLAIRLDEDSHHQLAVVAQLMELTVTDAIRQAIDRFVEVERARPELTKKAEALLVDIEQDAANRREAIANLFGGDGAASDRVSSPALKAARAPRSKGGDSASA